jgi:tetratricopeptide (TPR) repeat protein/uncharacterized caspase-like protein
MNIHIKSSFQLYASLLFVLALSASALAQADSPQASKTWAVVIGISKYAKLPGGQQLQFADNDAISFAETIKKGGVKPENVRLLTGADATVAAIKSAIGNWIARAAGESDTVLIFFSGHGLYEHEFGESYLLGYDSDPKDPYGSALSITEISQALGRRVNARQVVIIADAVRRDFFDPDAGGASKATAFTQAFNQLSSLRRGANAIIASGPGEFSREGQRWGGRGAFAKHLIDGLSGMADRNGDGRIASDELYEFVSARVSEDTSNKQHPWQSNPTLAQVYLTQTDSKQAAPIEIRQSEPRNKQTEATALAGSRKGEEAAKQPSETKPSQPSAITTAPARAEAAGAGPKTNRDVTSLKPDAKVEALSNAKSGNVAAPPVESAASIPPPSPPRRQPPPVVRDVEPTKQTGAPQLESGNKEIAIASTPAPPRPSMAPPKSAPVNEGGNTAQPGVVSTPISVSKAEAAPSPLILQLEAAIASNNLVEPKSASAWDLYQRLISEQGAQGELTRLKPMLADALASFGRSIVGGDVRADNITEKVDDFKRAGQMFARARSLMPENQEVVTYEKLSAAQALIALQFYDEAERALAQVAGAKLACVENALGLVYQGKLETYRAERAFKRATELDQKWATPHYNLALVYRGQQNEASLTEIEQAATLDPSNPVFLITLGDEYFTRQQWQRAADAFRKAVSLKPGDDALHTKLGHALYSQGLQAEANREYEKARQLRGKP